MEWGEYHHLLVGIHGLDLSHGDVDAPFQCLWVVVEMPSESCNGLSGLVPPLNVGLFFGFGVPDTDGQIGVIVVCSDEYQYGIKLVAAFFAEAVGLVGDVIPLPTVHGIDIAGGVKPFFQIFPVFLLSGWDIRIGDGIAEIGDPSLSPRVYFQ